MEILAGSKRVPGFEQIYWRAGPDKNSFKILKMFQNSKNVLKFFKCPQNRKVHFLYNFACVSVFWGSLFGNNPMKHFGSIIWGPTSVDVRLFVLESCPVGQIDTAPGGCFDMLVLQWQKACLKYSKTVQNRSLTIIDHQKLVITNFFVILFHEM